MVIEIETNQYTRLKNFVFLEENWDSYGAPPINEKAIETAKNILTFLDRVWVVPTCNGGVQMEVHSHGYDAELEINSQGDVESLFICKV